MPKPINITNERFGQLIAIRFDSIKKVGKLSYHYWLFKCDCGKEKIINKTTVKRGIVKSCGCLHKKKVFRKSPGEAQKTVKYHEYKRSARERKLEFNLTKDEFFKLTNENCFYCNSYPSNVSKSKNNTGDYIYNGIDRVDNNLGYIKNNCITCCKKCNYAKHDMTLDEFKVLIYRIYQNFSKKGLV